MLQWYVLVWYKMLYGYNLLKESCGCMRPQLNSIAMVYSKHYMLTLFHVLYDNYRRRVQGQLRINKQLLVKLKQLINRLAAQLLQEWAVALNRYCIASVKC